MVGIYDVVEYNKIDLFLACKLLDELNNDKSLFRSGLDPTRFVIVQLIQLIVYYLARVENYFCYSGTFFCPSDNTRGDDQPIKTGSLLILAKLMLTVQLSKWLFVYVLVIFYYFYRKWKAHVIPVTSLLVVPNSKTIISAGKVVKLWDTKQKVMLKV